MHFLLFRIVLKLAETCELGKALTGDWNVHKKSELSTFVQLLLHMSTLTPRKKKTTPQTPKKSQAVNSIL